MCTLSIELSLLLISAGYFDTESRPGGCWYWFVKFTSFSRNMKDFACDCFDTCGLLTMGFSVLYCCIFTFFYAFPRFTGTNALPTAGPPTGACCL